jgi:hypothetical protein
MIPSSFAEIRQFANNAFIQGNFSWYYQYKGSSMYYEISYGPNTSRYDL